MRITDLKTYPLKAPIGEAQGTGREAWSAVTVLLVRIETDTGLVGWGEGFARFIPAVYGELIEKLLKPIVVGADPFAVEALWQKMYRTLFGRSGGMLIEAIAAIDIAIWDVIGKALDQPLYRLFGDAGHERLPAYAAAIGWNDDQAAEAQVRQCLDWGFRQIKVRLGRPLETATRRARFVRDLVGPDIRLMADANWTYDVDSALVLAKVLADLDYYWFEEPIVPEDTEGYRLLAQKSPIRLAAGESEFTSMGIAPMLASRSVGIAQPDVTRSGGITETRKIASLARAFHIGYGPHVGFSGAICAAASLHLGASAPNFDSYECMIFASPLRDELAAEPVASRESLVDGCLSLPQGPGLGVTIDEGALERFRAD
jgi:D-galactarolactone cycloisomerase